MNTKEKFITQPYRISLKRDNFNSVFLPQAAKSFLWHRVTEAAGASLVLLSVIMMLAVFSYSSEDTSFNTAGRLDPNNLIGPFGALVSDLLLQFLGLASLIPIITSLIWGLRIIQKKLVSKVIFRLFILILGSLFYAVALSALEISPNWPLNTKMGGAIGTLALTTLTDYLTTKFTFISVYIVGIFCGLLGVTFWIAALGIPTQEWRSILNTIFLLCKLVINLLQKLYFIGAKLIKALCSKNLGDAIENIEKTVRFSKNKPDNKNTDLTDDSCQMENRSGIVDTKIGRPKVGAKSKIKSQGRLALGDGVYTCPPLELLFIPNSAVEHDNLNQDALQKNATFLSSVLQDFGVNGEIVKVRPGPVVTLYELEPAPGTKTSRVISLSDDIARSMSAVSVRVAVVAGRNVIGIELPNISREMVFLRELIASVDFEKSGAKLPLALGKNISGKPVTADLARMPHLLIAGTTGSGKSVAMNTMILSLLYQCPPDECKFIMIDPKMLELSVYEGIPHLLTPVVTDPSKAIVALKWVVREMEERYRAMSHLGVRSIAGFNARISEALKLGETLTRTVQIEFDEDGKPIYEDQPLSMKTLPFIVVVVDEMADLMLVAGKEVEAAIQRLAQMARAAGIHLIMATQRPSVDVITGTVKANFPTRISFQVTSKIDSRTILGEQGAEQLLGQGDMLYMAGGGRISRIHGPFVSDEEVEEIVNYLKTQQKPNYIEDITLEKATEPESPSKSMSGDPLYEQAVNLVATEQKASTSFIQRHLQIGYNRAARIIETMEKEQIISEANRVGRREVLISNH